MSELQQIQYELDRAGQRVAQLEKLLLDNPGYPSIAANLETALRIQAKLQAQLDSARAALDVNVLGLPGIEAKILGDEHKEIR